MMHITHDRITLRWWAKWTARGGSVDAVVDNYDWCSLPEGMNVIGCHEDG